MLQNFGETFKRHPLLIIGAVIIGALLIWAFFSRGDKGEAVGGGYPPGAIDPNVLAANTALQSAQIAANVQNAQTGAAVSMNENNNTTASQMQEQSIQGSLASQTSGQNYNLSAQNSAQSFQNQQAALAASLALNTEANNTYLSAMGLSPYAIAAMNGMGGGFGSGGAMGSGGSSSGGNAGYPGSVAGMGKEGQGPAPSLGSYTSPTSPEIVSQYSAFKYLSSGIGSPFEVLTQSGYTPPTGFNLQALADWLATGGSVTPQQSGVLTGYGLKGAPSTKTGPLQPNPA